MKRLTIKMRVTILCTLLAAAAAAVALIVILTTEQRMLTNYYRDSLVSTAQLAMDDIRYEDGDLDIDRNLDDLPNVRIALFTQDGDLIYGRRPFEKTFTHSKISGMHGSSGATKWMVYDTLLAFEEGESVWLRCYMSTDATESIHGTRTPLILIFFPILVLLAALGGFGIARRAFRPVLQIVSTAEGIADGADLKKRIALSGAQDEIYQIARVFDDMLDRLDHAFERECRFTSDASHELRTPVAAILAQSEFALSEAANAQDREEALAEIRDRAQYMADLTQRLMALARMDANPMPLIPESVDLAMMAEMAAQSLEESAAEKGIHLSVDAKEPVIISGDQTMLLQAVLNLTENAIRYGREGGHVSLCAKQSAHEAMLSVEDDGIGISEVDLAHIFDRFYQADTSRHGAGAGLGLSLVERIVHLHGGHIEIQSQHHVGSRFIITLPKGEHHL